MSKLDIKNLASKIKEKTAVDKAETAIVNPVLVEDIEHKDNTPLRSTQEQNNKPQKVEIPQIVVKQEVDKNENAAKTAFNLQDVINWQRPETVGKKKLVELHKEYDTFFAKVKATTGVPTVKFVNFLVRDFLLKNSDFVRSINEESGKSPQLE